MPKRFFNAEVIFIERFFFKLITFHARVQFKNKFKFVGYTKF